MKPLKNIDGLVHTTYQQLVGMQRYVPILAAQQLKRKVKSVLGGKNVSALRGRGMDFEEVRKYVAGDDIRHIDWKVTARTKTTHAKVFTEEKEKPVLIVVDQSASMFFGSKYKTKSVIAAELAALLAFKVQKTSDRVGLLCIGNESSELFRPKRTLNHVLGSLKMLNNYNNQLTNSSHEFNGKSVDLPMRQLFNVVTHDYTVIVISDFIHYNQSVMQSIYRIKQHNDVLLFKIYDEFEKEIMPKNFIATDGTYQTYLKAKNKNLRQDFKAGFQSQLTEFETQMKRHQINVFNLHTHQDVQQQLQQITLPL